MFFIVYVFYSLYSEYELIIMPTIFVYGSALLSFESLQIVMVKSLIFSLIYYIIGSIIFYETSANTKNDRAI